MEDGFAQTRRLSEGVPRLRSGQGCPDDGKGHGKSQSESGYRAAVNNAAAFINLQKKNGSFDDYIWSFTDGRVIHNNWRELDEIPAHTVLSDTVSKALKSEGFSFVGTTICYSFLQAGGIVNDHLVGCFRHKELKGG
jgi:DNA-3-methyladenine glycosylase I